MSTNAERKVLDNLDAAVASLDQAIATLSGPYRGEIRHDVKVLVDSIKVSRYFATNLRDDWESVFDDSDAAQ